jgi:phosphoglycerate dehydrogenase-like enzyme
VCNTYEHESTIAEYVLLGMLESRIGLRNMDAEFRAKGWAGRLPGSGVVHGEVRGATVGIVGYGHIGHEVALRARAFGMRAVGIRRSEPPCPPELDWLGTAARLDELLAISDFVVVACDLNDETRGLIDARRLGLMKPTAVIINVARGKVIDEAALYEALKARRIGGAVIDVWYNYNAPGEPEVRPANHPFEELDNILCSGHLSAWTREMNERRWDLVAENIRRVIRGDPPRNLLYHGTQARAATPSGG